MTGGGPLIEERPDAGRANGAGKLVPVTASVLAAILVLAHGVGTAADQAGAVNLGFLSPVRSADGIADEALVFASRGQGEAALERGRDAVRRSPVDQSVVRRLAEIEMAGSGADGWSGEAVRAAALLGWRDSVTQARLLMVRAQAGDIEGSIDHVDAVLRRTDISPELFAAIGQSMANRQIRLAMADRIAADPPWRGTLFQSVAEYGDAGTTPAFAQLLVDLHDRENRSLARAETDPVLSRLAALGLDDTLVDTANALEPGDTGRAFLNDRQFAAFEEQSDTLGNGPFDWKKGRAQRTVITVMPGPEDSDGRALKIRSRSRVPGVAVFQNLRLAPGSYSFEYRFRDAGKGLSWQIECGEQVLGSSVPGTEARGQSGGWNSASLDFNVPANCPVQRLQLLTGRNLGGQPVEGTFANLELTRR